MLNHLDMYDAIYELAAGDGCKEALFGSCAPLARTAFSRSLIGAGFPLVWFEVPLLGEPRFDLHVAFSREALCPGARFAAGAGNGYDALFEWYTLTERGGNGLAFAYDVSEGSIDAPAVHVNVNNAPLSDLDGFFDIAAGAYAADAYRSFAARLPRDWRVWYMGVHPGRPGSHLRVDCFVDSPKKEAYAADFARFEHDLRSCGFTAIAPVLRDLAQPLLDSPFGLELQFDVMRDGAVGDTLGISASLPLAAPSTIRALYEEGGDMATLLERVAAMGLADERWRRVPDTAFAKLVNLGDGPMVLYCAPVFLKLRLRGGAALDAKLYLQASARAIEG